MKKINKDEISKYTTFIVEKVDITTATIYGYWPAIKLFGITIKKQENKVYYSEPNMHDIYEWRREDGYEIHHELRWDLSEAMRAAKWVAERQSLLLT